MAYWMSMAVADLGFPRGAQLSRGCVNLLFCTRPWRPLESATEWYHYRFQKHEKIVNRKLTQTTIRKMQKLGSYQQWRIQVF